MEQSSLFEWTPEKRSILRGHWELLMSYLADGQWHKQKDISRHIHLPGTTVRQACQEFGGIIGLPQYGYRRIEYATQEEVRHALASLHSRRAKLANRIRQIEDFLYEE